MLKQVSKRGSIKDPETGITLYHAKGYMEDEILFQIAIENYKKEKISLQRALTILDGRFPSPYPLRKDDKEKARKVFRKIEREARKEEHGIGYVPIFDKKGGKIAIRPADANDPIDHNALLEVAKKRDKPAEKLEKGRDEIGRIIDMSGDEIRNHRHREEKNENAQREHKKKMSE